MTTTSILQRNARRIRREAATHLFTIGQVVRLKSGFGRVSQAADIYHITSTLPPRGDSPQYRIRNDDERHERAGISQSGDGETLIERTFGHGQGTETQQPRDQEAEAGKGAAEA
jgi:hypothetical protein